MRENTIIGFVGYKGSGKNTTSKLVLENMFGEHYTSQELMFSQKGKGALSKILGVPGNYLEEQLLKNATIEDLDILLKHRVYNEGLLKDLAKEFDIDYVGPKKMAKYLCKKIESLREAMQLLFTEFLRSYDEFIHIKATIKMIDLDLDVTTFTDIRFHEEFDSVREIGGLMVGVECEESRDAYLESVKNGESHSSESYIEDLLKRCDIIIDNNVKDLSALKTEIKVKLGDLKFSNKRLKVS